MKQLVITKRVTDRQTESFNQYLKEISSIQVLTPEEEIVLVEKTINGDEKAKEELIKKNLRFVVSVAKQYANPQNLLEDLVNEGNYGLIMAVDKFKPEMGFKFISYAVWWIRKVILEHINKYGRMVRIPANKINDLSKIGKQINELEQKLGRDVSIQEIEAEEGEYDFLDMINSYHIDSLDKDMSGDESDSVTLADLMSDDSFGPTDNILLTQDLKKELNSLLNTLKPRDKDIMIALFGLDGSQPRTLEDVGEQYGMTRERIRQIRERSLEKLRENIENTEIL